MKSFFHIGGLRKESAFSLIELSVAISIIMLVVSMALPNIITLKIKAARAEMQYNGRIIATAAHGFHAETSYYPGGTWGVFTELSPVLDDGGKTLSFCNGAFPLLPQDDMGLQMNDCENLRYFYQLSPGSCKSGGPTNRATCFTLSMLSSHTSLTWQEGVDSNFFGSRPPTRYCKKPNNYSLYFHDHWYMYEDFSAVPVVDPRTSDALVNCFAD